MKSILTIMILLVLAGCGQSQPTIMPDQTLATPQIQASSTPPPAAERLVYVKTSSEQQRSEIWISNLDGSDARVLKSCDLPCTLGLARGFNQRIVYYRIEQNTYEVHLLNLATQADTVFKTCNDECYAQFLELRADAVLYEISDMNNKELHILSDTGRETVWNLPLDTVLYSLAPDQSHMALIRMRGDGGIVEREQYSVWLLQRSSDEPQLLNQWTYTPSSIGWLSATQLVYSDDAVHLLTIQETRQDDIIAGGELVNVRPESSQIVVWLEPFYSDMGIDRGPSPFGVYNINGTQATLQQRLMLNTKQLTWSPDGTRLMQRLDTQIRLTNVSDGTSNNVKTLAQPPIQAKGVGVNFVQTIWSDDDATLVYTVAIGRPDFSQRIELRTLDLASNVETTLESLEWDTRHQLEFVLVR
ncbi:MAG: hypothetical protein KAX40_08135 [Herpetosiphon sp.]|nr:hypothetical protein [Herpetosiphon sp.]